MFFYFTCSYYFFKDVPMNHLRPLDDQSIEDDYHKLTALKNNLYPTVRRVEEELGVDLKQLQGFRLPKEKSDSTPRTVNLGKKRKLDNVGRFSVFRADFRDLLGDLDEVEGQLVEKIKQAAKFEAQNEAGASPALLTSDLLRRDVVVSNDQLKEVSSMSSVKKQPRRPEN